MSAADVLTYSLIQQQANPGAIARMSAAEVAESRQKGARFIRHLRDVLGPAATRERSERLGVGVTCGTWLESFAVDGDVVSADCACPLGLVLLDEQPSGFARACEEDPTDMGGCFDLAAKRFLLTVREVRWYIGGVDGGARQYPRRKTRYVGPWLRALMLPRALWLLGRRVASATGLRESWPENGEEE